VVEQFYHQLITFIVTAEFNSVFNLKNTIF